MTVHEDELRVHRDTQRWVWGTSGDYAQVAPHLEQAATALVARLGTLSGVELLDVATGTGNVALAAARTGARVTALDLTPALLEQARGRAAGEQLDVAWVEGDAEALPFPDATFEAVTSVFGVMFAPRHAVAAGELARVCRPGGRIAVAAWTPEGFVGRTAAIAGEVVPSRPPWALPPTSWGDETHMRLLFASYAADLRCERLQVEYRFPSVEAFQAFIERQAFYPLILRAAREHGREAQVREAMLEPPASTTPATRRAR
jgi:ubiquinone/menaquinone biosynthesis C-methylase UbiE